MIKTRSHSFDAEPVHGGRAVHTAIPLLMLFALFTGDRAWAQGRSSAPDLGAIGRSSQPVERNLPPVAETQTGITIQTQDIAGSEDSTPLGVTLRGIHLIGLDEKPSAHPTPGVVISAIGDIPRETLSRALAPFLGRPASRKLIGELQAAIAHVYRDAGFPFVSVTLPPQEITSGLITVRVVEFRAGDVKVSSGDPTLVQKVRAVRGQRISAEALDEDLLWLNRNPYRSVAGVFTPDTELGFSTLTLEVTPQKPWQIFSGWSNTGTRATGYDRYFAGFGAALPYLNDSYVSYQITGSPNFWLSPSDVGAGPLQPSYYSQAGRVVIGVSDRQSVELVPSYVATRQAGSVSGFDFTNETFEIPVYYRSAVSNFIPNGYWGDFILGVTAKGTSRTSYFSETGIGGASAGLFEIILGWTAARSDTYGSTEFDVRLLANPGGVVGGNSSASWANFTSGRVDQINYIYGIIDVNRKTRLPFGLTLSSQLYASVSGQSLPDTEQISLGGLYATRGYTLDDGSTDTGFFWRNELRTQAFPILSAFGVSGQNDLASPFLFADVGWGRTFAYQGPLGPISSSDVSLAGIGFGIDYSVGRSLTTSFIAGVALTDAYITQAGDITIQTRATIIY